MTTTTSFPSISGRLATSTAAFSAAPDDSPARMPSSAATVSQLTGEAQAHLTRRELEESLRVELAELGRPMVELPLLPDGVNLTGLQDLAGRLLRA